MNAKGLFLIFWLTGAFVTIRGVGESDRPQQPGMAVTAQQGPPGAFDYDFQFVCKLGATGRVYKCHLLNPTGHAEFDRWAWDYCKGNYRESRDAAETTYLVLHYRLKRPKNG